MIEQRCYYYSVAFLQYFILETAFPLDMEYKYNLNL